MSDGNRVPKRFGRLLFFVAAGVLLVVMAALPSTGFFSADSGPKYWQALAFAHGSGWPRTFGYPAADVDPSMRRVPLFTQPLGKGLVSVYPVLFPVMTSVPLRLGGDRALRLVPWLCGLLAAWAAGRLASSLRGEDVTGWVAATVLSATPLAFYSLAFWEHSLAVAMVVGSVALVSRNEMDGNGWRWMLSGLILGLGAWVRTEIGFLAPLLMVLPVVGRVRGGPRLAVVALAGWVAGGAAGALIQFATLGRWLPLHVSYHMESSFRHVPFVASRIESLAKWLIPDRSCALATAAWCVAVIVLLTPKGGRSKTGLALALAAVVTALAATLVVPAFRWLQGARPTDAFPYAAPAATWVVLSALPVVLWGRARSGVDDRRRLLVATVAVLLPVVVFVARAVRSFEWGARVMLPAMVLLVAIMGSIPFAEGGWKRVRRAAIGLAVATGVAVQAVGLVLLHHGATTHAEIASEIEAFSDQSEPVVTDAYLVPLISGRGWFGRRFLYCVGQRSLSEVVDALSDDATLRWTYATVERAPGKRLKVPDHVRGTDGTSWIVTHRLERNAGSRTVRLLGFRRVVLGEVVSDR